MTVDRSSVVHHAADVPSRLARRTLAAFVLTFLISRVVVLLIMTRRMPDLYFYAGQTHVHHLNYGIFLLCGTGAWLLFRPPAGRARRVAAVLYGIGLGLTFDEFGMWLHLGGPYWQRASYDAVVTVAGLLGLIAYAPSVRQFHARAWAVAGAIAVVLAVGAWLAVGELNRVTPELEKIETAAPQ